MSCRLVRGWPPCRDRVLLPVASAAPHGVSGTAAPWELPSAKKTARCGRAPRPWQPLEGLLGGGGGLPRSAGSWSSTAVDTGRRMVRLCHASRSRIIWAREVPWNHVPSPSSSGRVDLQGTPASGRAGSQPGAWEAVGDMTAVRACCINQESEESEKSAAAISRECCEGGSEGGRMNPSTPTASGGRVSCCQTRGLPSPTRG